MAALPGEYEDGGDEDFTLPLPPEDRLWRHPSEVAGNELGLRLDPTVVRNRWLSSQPSRASAWTAGLVGALLASGLVVLGTHLATALTGAPARDTPITLSSLAAPHAAAHTTSPRLAALGPSLLKSVERVGAAVVTIDVARGAADLSVLGMILDKDGTVLTAAAPLDGATSVIVTLPGNVVVPAVTIASDEASGLAVLRVKGASEMPIAKLAAGPAEVSGLAVAVTAAGGDNYVVGDVRSLDVSPAVASDVLVDAQLTDLPTADTPPGSPILNPAGQVVGLVAGASAQGTAVVPGWLALPVTKQLLTRGEVRHGWIGISGENNPAGPAGALVKAVAAAGAGAEAGLRVGDVITAIDGQPVRSLAALEGRLYTTEPGASVIVSVRRGASHLSKRLLLDDQRAA